jgi:hypothetical protein
MGCKEIPSAQFEVATFKGLQALLERSDGVLTSLMAALMITG